MSVQNEHKIWSRKIHKAQSSRLVFGMSDYIPHFGNIFHEKYLSFSVVLLVLDRIIPWLLHDQFLSISFQFSVIIYVIIDAFSLK
jgi:hypothetical protein